MLIGVWKRRCSQRIDDWSSAMQVRRSRASVQRRLRKYHLAMRGISAWTICGRGQLAQQAERNTTSIRSHQCKHWGIVESACPHNVRSPAQRRKFIFLATKRQRNCCLGCAPAAQFRGKSCACDQFGLIADQVACASSLKQDFKVAQNDRKALGRIDHLGDVVWAAEA